MKKLSFATLGIILIALLYYFTAGSEKVANKMKLHLDTELASLQTQGFSVKGREISEKKEHFVIAFNEPKKIALFLSQKGSEVTQEELEALKGLEVGVDINYLADTYSAVSFDLYPITLPVGITASATSQEDKKILAQMKNLLKKKTFLLHADINKLGTGFKGYMKDIDEVLNADDTVHFVLKKLKFSGDIENNTVSAVTQTLKILNIDAGDTLNMSLNGLKSIYKVTGKSAYEYKVSYVVESINMQQKDTMLFKIKNFEALSNANVKDALLNSSVKTKIEQIQIGKEKEKIVLDTLVFDIKADNLDLKAIETFENIDPNNEQEINTALQALVSKGMRLEIPTLSIENIEGMGKKMQGFHLDLSLDVDKSLNIAALQQNPMLALNALNANINLTLSKEFYTLISQQPQAMMALMLFQPKEVKGKKVYAIELKNGKLTVNGSPVM